MLSQADVTLNAWDEYFREGGTLNQPPWMENHKLKKLKTFYSRLVRISPRMAKSEPSAIGKHGETNVKSL